MKHIKTFENYKPVNELTGALVDRARKQAEHGDHGDEISSEIKVRQKGTFSTYLNPKLKELASKFGFNAEKMDDQWLKIYVPTDEGSSVFFIATDGQLNNFKAEEFDSGMLRKIKTFQQAVIKDYRQNNEL